MEIVEASIGGVLSDLVASHKFRTYDLMIMRICGILSFPYEILWVFFFMIDYGLIMSLLWHV